jgi:hypothetical protein
VQDGPPPDLDVDADPERLELDLAKSTVPKPPLLAEDRRRRNPAAVRRDHARPSSAGRPGGGKAMQGGGKPCTLETWHADALFDEWGYRRRAYRRQAHVYLHQAFTRR